METVDKEHEEQGCLSYILQFICAVLIIRLFCKMLWYVGDKIFNGDTEVISEEVTKEAKENKK